MKIYRFRNKKTGKFVENIDYGSIRYSNGRGALYFSTDTVTNKILALMNIIFHTKTPPAEISDDNEVRYTFYDMTEKLYPPVTELRQSINASAVLEALDLELLEYELTEPDTTQSIVSDENLFFEAKGKWITSSLAKSKKIKQSDAELFISCLAKVKATGSQFYAIVRYEARNEEVEEFLKNNKDYLRQLPSQPGQDSPVNNFAAIDHATVNLFKLTFPNISIEVTLFEDLYRDYLEFDAVFKETFGGQKQ